MADPNINKTPEDMKKNETMQREQGKPGQPGFDKDRKPEQGGFDKDRQPEKGADKEREEKSAIGGGDRQQSQQGGQSPTGQQRGEEFDKSRSERSR